MPKGLADPDLMPNLKVAAERIARAIRDKEKVVIYGDYDVDGITATAILWHAIRLLGGEVDYYIPHRIDEGYWPERRGAGADLRRGRAGDRDGGLRDHGGGAGEGGLRSRGGSDHHRSPRVARGRGRRGSGGRCFRTV